MSVPTAILTGVAMGAVFGIALEKSRVFEPGVILGQVQLRNFLMLRIFLTAVATGLVVLAALNGAGLATLHPKTTMYLADALGGALLGVGITLAGGLAGAVAFTYAEPALRLVLLTGAGTLTLDRLVAVPFWQIALGFAAVLVAGLAALERWRSWRDEIGPAADGLQPPD